MKVFSKRKWQKLSLSQKLTVWFENYLYIERCLAENQTVDPLFFEQVSLLQNETNVQLKQLSCIGSNYEVTKIYQELRKIFSEQILNQKDFHFLPPKRHPSSNPKCPVLVILDNLRSAFNVGSIIRTAECLNVESVWLCGNTPLPNHPKVKNTAMGTEKRITWQHFYTTVDAILKAHEHNYSVLAIETGEDAVPIYDHEYSSKIAIVMGNEALGIEQNVLKLCDRKLNIPITGWKQSLNVASAFTVVCCYAVHKLEKK